MLTFWGLRSAILGKTCTYINTAHSHEDLLQKAASIQTRTGLPKFLKIWGFSMAVAGCIPPSTALWFRAEFTAAWAMTKFAEPSRPVRQRLKECYEQSRGEKGERKIISTSIGLDEPSIFLSLIFKLDIRVHVNWDQISRTVLKG